MLGRGAIHHICRQAHPAKLFREIAIPRNAEGPTPGNGCECEQQGSRPAGSTTCSAVEQSARNGPCGPASFVGREPEIALLLGSQEAGLAGRRS